MKNCVTKVQHQNKKNQTVILILQDIALTFWYIVLLTWIYDDTVQNSLTIGKYLETTCSSELSKWYDEIILKEE